MYTWELVLAMMLNGSATEEKWLISVFHPYKHDDRATISSDICERSVLYIPALLIIYNNYTTALIIYLTFLR